MYNSKTTMGLKFNNETFTSDIYIYGIDNALVEVIMKKFQLWMALQNFWKSNQRWTELSEKENAQVSEKIQLVDGQRKISIEPSSTNFETNFN